MTAACPALVPATVFLFLLIAGGADAGINFISTSPAAAHVDVTRVASGDLDQDGLADLVTVSPRSKQVTVYLAQTEPPGWELDRSYVVGQTPSWVAVGDLNGDGRADVACADAAARGVWILLGAFDAMLQHPFLVDVGRRIDAVAIAEFDGRDGTDLVAADFTAGGAGGVE